MVELRHHQRLLWKGWFPEPAAGWWDEWIRQADPPLDDDELWEAVKPRLGVTQDSQPHEDAAEIKRKHGASLRGRELQGMVA